MDVENPPAPVPLLIVPTHSLRQQDPKAHRPAPRPQTRRGWLKRSQPEKKPDSKDPDDPKRPHADPTIQKGKEPDTLPKVEKEADPIPAKILDQDYHVISRLNRLAGAIRWRVIPSTLEAQAKGVLTKTLAALTVLAVLLVLHDMYMDGDYHPILLLVIIGFWFTTHYLLRGATVLSVRESYCLGVWRGEDSPDVEMRPQSLRICDANRVHEARYIDVVFRKDLRVDLPIYPWRIKRHEVILKLPAELIAQTLNGLSSAVRGDEAKLVLDNLMHRCPYVNIDRYDVLGGESPVATASHFAQVVHEHNLRESFGKDF